ncbi:MAG: nucleotidyl transferase AbiEii/AbiGii toxin family protein [Candidatus Gracilibacteria bacterium]
MLNKEQHQLIMGRILKDIYSDVSIASLLGFKGGTCAYFFYGLPRFSVDLDFDLLSTDSEKKKIIFEKILNILKKYGTVKNPYIKRSTIIAVLSYGDADHNIKVEISTRVTPVDLKNHYELKEYLGISMMVAKKDYLFGSKLSALTLRSSVAMRDIYDLYFFALHDWDLNGDVVKTLTGKPLKEHLSDCLKVIEKVKDNRILDGLGELLDEKEKEWVRNNLKKETIFALKNYISVLK